MSKKQRLEANRQAQRRARARTWGVVALFAVVAGILVFFVTRSGDTERPEMAGVERPANAGAGHVAVGTELDYGTAAPTSGDHWERWAPCGAYDEQPPLGAVVHTLEHGAVVLWYQPDLGDDGRSRLVALMERAGSHVVVAPNPGIDRPVVATAWDRRLAFDTADDPRIAEFVETYRFRGPERVACPLEAA